MFIRILEWSDHNIRAIQLILDTLSNQTYKLFFKSIHIVPQKRIITVSGKQILISVLNQSVIFLSIIIFFVRKYVMGYNFWRDYNRKPFRFRYQGRIAFFWAGIRVLLQKKIWLMIISGTLYYSNYIEETWYVICLGISYLVE